MQNVGLQQNGLTWLAVQMTLPRHYMQPDERLMKPAMLCSHNCLRADSSPAERSISPTTLMVCEGLNGIHGQCGRGRPASVHTAALQGVSICCQHSASAPWCPYG